VCKPTERTQKKIGRTETKSIGETTGSFAICGWQKSRLGRSEKGQESGEPLH